MADPRTPLTMMRSVQASMSRDRSEIDEARRPLFQADDAPGVGTRAEGDAAPRGTADAQMGSGADYENSEGLYEETEEEEEEEDPYASLSDRVVPHPSCVPYGAEVTVRLRNPTSLLTLRVRRPGTLTEAKTGALGKRSVFLGGEDDDGEFLLYLSWILLA